MESAYLKVQAVLQAGGRGSRLDPAARGVPKPLVKVAGVPMVERLLRQLASSGVRKVCVMTGWMGEQIESYLQGLTCLPDDLQLQFLHESRPMGNVGGLVRLQSIVEPVLLVFADLVTNLDFAKLMTIHQRTGSQVTLASHYEKHQLQLGELVVDDDHVTGYLEKPLKEFLICSGIAIFEPQVLRLLDDSQPSGISDLVNLAIRQGMKVTHWTHGAVWLDVNTLEALEEADEIVKGLCSS